MKRPFLSLLISCLATLCAQAQLHCTFTHYSLENGLSENTVMDMVQDHDGLVWIATWHGINCFDGYNFRVFTARQSHTAEWTSNRIDHLSVDAKGDVWCISYDSHAFRLDRHLETFQEVPVQTDGQHKPIIALRPLDNGTMWLLTDHDGGYRMTDGEAVVIGEGTRIHQVFLDSQGTEWVLTDNGLLRIDPKEGKVVSYFTQQGTGKADGQPFFSVEEADGTLLFGSANGRVWMYSMSQDLFDLRELPLKDDVIAIQETGDGQQVAVTATQGIVTGSIANGFAFGFVSYVFMKTAVGKYKEVSWIMWLVSIAFVINLVRSKELAEQSGVLRCQILFRQLLSIFIQYRHSQISGELAFFNFQLKGNARIVLFMAVAILQHISFAIFCFLPHGDGSVGSEILFGNQRRCSIRFRSWGRK